MVQKQIEGRVEDERVLDVMRNTPRHLFVPEPLRSQAWHNRPLPIGHGQTISQPLIVAIMTEALELKGKEKVLEIGTGSGYQAAVLAQLADSVYSIEIVEPLAKSVKRRLDSLGYRNIQVLWGDGYKGWPEHAPFDAIIVTAAPKEVPQALVAQLKMGGRMVLPVGSHFQELLLVTKTEQGVKERYITAVRFVPMVKEKK